MTVDGLVSWLRAQLDDEERVARAAGGCAWDLPAKAGYPAGFDAQLEAEEAHTTRWHPARVLAEVDAKRRIIDEHPVIAEPYRLAGRCERCYSHEDEVAGGAPAKHPCLTLRLLALPYADRPGYREEWAPNA